LKVDERKLTMAPGALYITK